MSTPQNFSELVYFFVDLMSLIIPLIFSAALLIIVWKIIDAWVIHAGDTKKIDEGKKYALWGILVLVVMSSVWAILRLLKTSIFGY